jgi:hypothetical protein
MRIAHLTDIHLRHHLPGTSEKTERQCRRMPELLPQALQRIADAKVDLLALTGDLIESPEQITRETHEQAVHDYQMIRDHLHASGLRYIITPGNHDHEPAMWEVFPRNDDVVEIAGLTIARYCDREYPPHIPRRTGRSAELFEQILNRPGRAPVVHLQHYVIHPPLLRHPHSYEEHEALTERLANDDRSHLCLSGHYHQGTDVLSVGRAIFNTTPAFCIEPYTWRLFEFDAEHFNWSQHTLG